MPITKNTIQLPKKLNEKSKRSTACVFSEYKDICANEKNNPKLPFVGVP